MIESIDNKEFYMYELWYYVLDGQRLGPVSKEEIQQMFHDSKLTREDFVWTKGFDNWTNLQDVPELMEDPLGEDAMLPDAPSPAIPPVVELQTPAKPKLSDVGLGKSIFIRVGPDRGLPPTDYGPFNIAMMKKLFKERRVNANTLTFYPGLDNWKILGEFEDFTEVFETEMPELEPEEKRRNPRKPFIARLFLHNEEKVFEGVCRDISVGGMQILVDDYDAETGQTLSFNVHPENDDFHFVASGKVVRVLDGNKGFSFRFINLSEEAKNAIEKYIQNEP